MTTKALARRIARAAGWYDARDALARRAADEAFTRVVVDSPATRADADWVADSLAERRTARRALSPRPRVIAYGARRWEVHGLWPTFERRTELELIEVGAPDVWTEEACRASNGRLLDAVDRRQREGAPVELVFAYCDARFFPRALIAELARRRIWTVLMGLDDQHRLAPHRAHGTVAGQRDVVADVDVYWTTWKLGADLVAALGGRPFLAGEGADPAFHRPLDVARDLDVAFVGMRYGARARLVEHLRRHGFRVATFGAGWPSGPIDFDETVRVYSRARVVLGLGNVGAARGVFCLKGRDFEVPMCGAVYLTSFHPDLADCFEINREVLAYASPETCVEVLRWILARPDEQARIRAAALARSLRDHTWERRLEALFARITG